MLIGNCLNKHLKLLLQIICKSHAEHLHFLLYRVKSNLFNNILLRNRPVRLYPFNSISKHIGAGQDPDFLTSFAVEGYGVGKGNLC